MYRKIIALFFMMSATGMAQNIQLHYEASEDREFFVSTLEMFKPDPYGSTFWFVDMEHAAPGVKAASLAYWEIARNFKLPIEQLTATVQYNDGVATFGGLGQVWLAGINYYLDLGLVALPIDILYRSAQGADSPDFQLTTTWFVPFMDGNMEFSGFLDFWSQDKVGSEGKDLILLSEPQLWYNANDHFSIGGEVEVSRNFIFGSDGVEVLPTLGLRWIF